MMPNVQESYRAVRRRFEKISAHQLGRPRARLGNPNTGIPEAVVQPIFDIYFVAVGTAMPKLFLFTVPNGQSYNFGGVTAFTKGFGHTNLVQAGMLESSYTFIARALSVYAQALQGQANPLLHPQDLINILSSFFQWQINRKPYFEGIGAWLPGGGGVMTFAAATLTAPASIQNSVNGWPDARNIYVIPGGQFINPQETFTLLIDPTGNAGGTPSTLAAAGNPAGVPAAGLSLWFRMDGTLIRVAQ